MRWRRALRLHPDYGCAALSRIEVEVERDPAGRLGLVYRAIGDADALRFPPPAAPERTDELWRHTCCEAFLRRPLGEGYREFNFAPSTQWAAYQFDGYRSGMTPVEDAAPRIAVDRIEGGLELRASLDLNRGPWRLGLSAVIEETDGTISYWALAHPAGKADFHHPDCFDLELPATEGA